MKIVDKRNGVVIGRDTVDDITVVVISPDAFKSDGGTPTILWEGCKKYTYPAGDTSGFELKVPDGCRVAFLAGSADATGLINNMDTRNTVSMVDTGVEGGPVSHFRVTPPMRSGEVFMYVMDA